MTEVKTVYWYSSAEELLFELGDTLHNSFPFHSNLFDFDIKNHIPTFVHHRTGVQVWLGHDMHFQWSSPDGMTEQDLLRILTDCLNSLPSIPKRKRRYRLEK